MHIAVLNANVDRSAFARGWPDDAEKVIHGLRPLRPGWHYEVWQACDGELPPEDNPAEGWVITGSVASVNDAAPWMQALEQRVRARHAQRLPTAGLCFGHQIIAKALGGRVGLSPGGWRLGVARTRFASPEPWMSPWQDDITLFAAHQEQLGSPVRSSIVRRRKGRCSMPPNSLFLLLLQKADEDLYILDKLVADDAAPVTAFGFHAQQATEKLLKAVLSFHGIEYARTHRLAELADLAGDHGVQLPEVVEQLVDLTPYAVEFRYDAAPDDRSDELDKRLIRNQIAEFRAWVLAHAQEGR